MSRLTARLASTFLAATSFALAAGEAIGGRRLRVVVEFCCRRANCRSRSAMCFCASAIRCWASASCRSRSANSRRSRSFSRFSRSSAPALRGRFVVCDTPRTVRRSDQSVQPPELLLSFFVRILLESSRCLGSLVVSIVGSVLLMVLLRHVHPRRTAGSFGGRRPCASFLGFS